MKELEPIGQRACPRCGAAFVCEFELGINPCWCSRQFPAVLPFEQAHEGCLCPACVKLAVEDGLEIPPG